MNENKNLHPFEASGCGIGPFQFVGTAEIPSPSLGEANPDAYQNALRALPKLSGGCGTCRHCGMAIMIICIVRDSTGKLFGVGSDCIAKVNDPALGDPAKVAVQRRRRELDRERREAKRRAKFEAWAASPEGKAAKARAEAQRQAALEQREATQKKVLAKWGFLLPVIEGQGGFRHSIAEAIKDGQEPQGRAIDILADIWAKAHGRGGSKAFQAARSEFWKNIEN
jgi:hypothetical protein